MDIVDLEKFISFVNIYWDFFRQLISNLSFEEETIFTQSSDKIIGTIEFGRTIRLRNNQSTDNVICAIYSKNIYTPENILAGLTLFGINIHANTFLKSGRAGDIQEFDQKHDTVLMRIIGYTDFLLQDRLLKRLLEYYFENYENIERVMRLVNQRIIEGKIPIRYYPLIRFAIDWKTNWILNEPGKPFRAALTPILEEIPEHYLYEMWIFYKVLTLFEPVRQTRANNIFVNDKSNFSVEYHHQKDIGWTLERNEGDGITDVKELKRIPDILIMRNESDFAIIDAKCMTYSEIEDTEQEPGPTVDIANQMIIYMDYGGRCDLGMVLFADDRIRNDIMIKQKESRKIIFMNCYPYRRSGTDAFERIRYYLDMQQASN